jgi:hypothetical protein
MESNYFDGVLIKLKRQYSKDETVMSLTKKLSDVHIELGKANAYIHELEDGKGESRQIAKLQLEVKRLEKSNKELIFKYLRTQ